MTWTTRQRSEIGDLAVITCGQGPRLILIHGVGLRAEAWNAQIEVLSEKFEVVAPDLPGHGESPLLPEPASLADYSERIASLLDRPTIIAGHSMGALIALDIASRNPEHILGVVALNAIYRRTDAARAAVNLRAASLDGASVPEPEPTLTRWFGDQASPEREACKIWLRNVDPKGYQSAYRVFSEEDGPSDESLKSLRCPALFLTGSLEPNSTPAMSRAMAALAPNGGVQVIETAAHMMPMTHSAEVTDALRNFAEGCLS
ncbi:AB hydrolase superfamily protein YvaM [Roseibium album]|nr:AB hydrolase superfamily protein YvaM [Roseibium album]